MARQKKAKSNPSYPIPLDFPVERYTYAPAPTLAHWTSYPKYSYEMFTRPNPALRPVPDHIPKTPRSAATHISAIGRPGEWPIGDLYHARLALIYSMSPSHERWRAWSGNMDREKILRAVKKHYPQYDWDTWFHAKMKAKQRRAEKNPKPSIPYADWRAALLRAEARKDKKLVRILQAAMDLGAVQQTRQAVAQQNPFDFTPKNAGPYLPDMFPYGIGGRPQTYDPLPTTPTPAELAAKAAVTAKKNGKRR